MRVKALNLFNVLLSSCLLTGLVSCAQAPVTMSYLADTYDQKTTPLWPDLPEVPRYSYAGQLLGDRNFTTVESDETGIFEKALNWIVGLSSTGDIRSLLRPQSGMVLGDRIYVTDVGLGAIFVFDSSVAGLQIWNLADNGVNFVSPIGITEGPDQSLLVTDSQLGRIVRLSLDGNPLGSFGEGVLSRPTGIVRDTVGRRVYVVDTHAHDIKVFDDNGLLVDVLGRRGTGAGEFNSPVHISISNGRLYVSDTLNARVQVLTLDGEPVNVIGERGLYLGNMIRPKGVAIGDDGNIHVVESYYDHLLVFDEKGNFLLPIGGSGNGIGQFYLPAGAWSDDQGHIYVADMYNGRVIIFRYLGA